MPSLQPAHGKPQLIPYLRDPRSYCQQNQTLLQNRREHESGHLAISLPGLSTAYSAPWKAKAAPGLKDGGWGEAGSWPRGCITQSTHTHLSDTLHLPMTSHLLCISTMLMVAHDSVLCTGPQGLEMGHCQEDGRASGVGEDWKRVTGPFLFFCRPLLFIYFI